MDEHAFKFQRHFFLGDDTFAFSIVSSETQFKLWLIPPPTHPPEWCVVLDSQNYTELQRNEWPFQFEMGWQGLHPVFPS